MLPGFSTGMLLGSVAGGAGGISSASMEGVWTWFNDPRAIVVDGSPAIGVVRSDGRIGVYHATVTSPTITLLRAGVFQVDDHANPSLLKRASDGRILAFASAHNGGAIYKYLSTNADDVTAWGAEVDLDSQLGRAQYSYTNPVQLTGEVDDPIWLFFRATDGSNLQDYYSKSTDGGATWAAATQWLARISGTWPPYFRAAQNGDSRIDFCCTDGSPNDIATNSIYHFYYEGGSFRKTDGTALTLPITPSTDVTPIWDGSAGGGHAWVWDIAIDGSGNPVIAYAVFPSISGHRYRYAKWNGVSAWADNEVGPAGGFLYRDQSYYSGGIRLDPGDVNIVYTCRQLTDGVHHLLRHVTADGGATWAVTRKTSGNSSHFRPFIVGTTEPRLAVVKGPYGTYTDYASTIELVSSGAGPAFTTAPAGDSTYWGDVVLAGGPIGDQSASAHTMTWRDGTRVRGQEIIVPATGGLLVEATTPFNFGSGNFKVKVAGARHYSWPTSTPEILASQYNLVGDNRGWDIRLDLDDLLKVVFTTDGTAGTVVTPLSYDVRANIGLNVPYDVEVERIDSAWTLKINGVEVDSATDSSTIFASTAFAGLGVWANGQGLLDGAFKRVEITKAGTVVLDVGGSGLHNGDRSDASHEIVFGNTVKTVGQEIAFNGSRTCVAPHSTYQWLDDGDFTIEFPPISFNSTAGTHDLMGKWVSNSYLVRFSSSALRFFYSTTGSNQTELTAAWSPTVGVEYKITIQRSGSTLRFFVDGVMIGSPTITGSLHRSTRDLGIGCSTHSNTQLNGRMTGWPRITKTDRYGDSDSSHSPATWPLDTL